MAIERPSIHRNDAFICHLGEVLLLERFDSILSRNVDAKWHFSQENATSHDLQMAAFEAKPL